jgi:hypothetical protein
MSQYQTELGRNIALNCTQILLLTYFHVDDMIEFMRFCSTAEDIV